MPPLIPDLKTAADYMGPLTELTTGKGFKVVHGALRISRRHEAHACAAISSASLGPSPCINHPWCSLRRALVSFTFIGGSDDELDELIEKLAFFRKSR